MKTKKEQKLSGVFIFIILALIGVVVWIQVTSGRSNDIRSQAAGGTCDDKRSVYSCQNISVGALSENGKKKCFGTKKLENGFWRCEAVATDETTGRNTIDACTNFSSENTCEANNCAWYICDSSCHKGGTSLGKVCGCNYINDTSMVSNPKMACKDAEECKWNTTDEICEDR